MKSRDEMWVREIAWIEPTKAAGRLAGLAGVSFLDSAMEHSGLGRHSILAADPFGIFQVENGRGAWNAQSLPGDPLEALRTLLARYPIEADPDLPPFQGGAIGTFSYEFGWVLDHGPGRPPAAAGETARFAFYDTLVSFDHRAKRCWILASGWPAETGSARQSRAASRIAVFLSRLQETPESAPRPRASLQWQNHTTAEAHRASVERVKDYIAAGDIYQANLAQRFSAPVPKGADSFSLYQQLRVANPAPFAAYLCCGPKTVLSSSPERFVRLRGRDVETRPIKGTVRRAADSTTDEALARALLHSDKDRAENIMIVDLLRSDLSRVCDPDSVDVPVLCGLETYAGLHHLVSAVTGTLREGLDALDLVAATFPGGSITGAPKLRAMEIIADLEDAPRGIYCGAIGAIGFDGFIDLNIAIRTVVIENGLATFQAGGGITILSDAEAEYRETLVKAQRIFAAFAAGEAVDGEVSA